MRSPVESRGAWSALVVVALLAATIWLGDLMADRATAEPARALQTPAAAPAARSEAARARVRARFVSHHEDDEERDEDDDEEEEDDDDDFDDDDFEEEMLRGEMERLHLRSMYGGLELIEKLTQIVSDDDGAAVLAVTRIAETLEPEQQVGVLQEVVEGSSSKAARRIARLRLADAYAQMGQPRAAWRALRPVAMQAERDDD